MYALFKDFYESKLIKWFTIFNDTLYCVFLSIMCIDFVNGSKIMSLGVTNNCTRIIFISNFSSIALGVLQLCTLIYEKIKNCFNAQKKIMPTCESKITSIQSKNDLFSKP